MLSNVQHLSTNFRESIYKKMNLMQAYTKLVYLRKPRY
jgi:hypothetical protein